MPQIAQIGEIFGSQLFWLAIFFGGLFIVVGLGMVPKIQSTVDARDAKIAADLKEAESARETADRMEEAYRERMEKARVEANRLAAEAKAEAARATEARVSEASQAIHAKVEAAEARIAEALAASMTEVEAVAAEAAQAMVERVAGLNVEPEAARAAVARELAHG